MTDTRAEPAALSRALARYRARDLPGARREAEAAVAAGEAAAPLLAFAGLAACQDGDPAAGVVHLRRAIAAAPRDATVRANLASALVATGGYDEALAVCSWGPEEPRLRRITAWVHQEQGRAENAIRDYEALLGQWPDDFESWTNLGNLLAEAGRTDRAVAALGRAAALRPDIAQHHLNLARVLAAAGLASERRDALATAAAALPDEPEILLEHGLAEAAAGALDEAERAFRAAIPVSASPAAFVELGLLLENRNRVDALAELVGEAEQRGVDAAEIDFLRAWLLRRQGRLADAMPLAERTPETINPIRRWQLIAELADRLGDPARAFDAFTRMNEAARAAHPGAAAEGDAYLAEIEDTIRHTTAAEVARWAPAPPPGEPRAPVFIVGFPRSGTTLLDTLLMNVPGLHVLEELPVLRQAEVALGGAERLAIVDTPEVARLRGVYANALAELSPPAQGAMVVDKHPLHMARVPLIHRLFPDARIVLVERHPMDVVLSCFMANFQLNRGMVHFTDLAAAAHLYDRAWTAWTEAAAVLPVRVHRVRYERMVADLESEMKPLLSFLDLPWDEAVLDNRASAARRGHIRTASYAQVTEPIYNRAAGRWMRYRAELAPVVPVLAPWVERLGYEL